MSTKIKTPDGWKDVASGGLINDEYSTEEKRVGIWIDGKPIFRTYVSFPSIELTPLAWNSVGSLSITGIDKIINARAIGSGDNAVIPLAARSIGTSIEVEAFSNFRISSLILEYTKH